MASIKCIIPVRGKKKKGCARLHIPLECLQKGMNGTVYKIHALCFFYGTVLMNEKKHSRQFCENVVCTNPIQSNCLFIFDRQLHCLIPNVRYFNG